MDVEVRQSYDGEQVTIEIRDNDGELRIEETMSAIDAIGLSHMIQMKALAALQFVERLSAAASRPT